MSLKQSLAKIEEGKVLVIHSDSAMRAFVKDIQKLDLNAQTVVYLNCNEMPGLLDEGEWEWYLTQPEENSEITDQDVRHKIAAQEQIRHKDYYCIATE